MKTSSFSCVPHMISQITQTTQKYQDPAIPFSWNTLDDEQESRYLLVSITINCSPFPTGNHYTLGKGLFSTQHTGQNWAACEAQAFQPTHHTWWWFLIMPWVQETNSCTLSRWTRAWVAMHFTVQTGADFKEQKIFEKLSRTSCPLCHRTTILVQSRLFVLLCFPVSGTIWTSRVLSMAC